METTFQVINNQNRLILKKALQFCGAFKPNTKKLYIYKNVLRNPQLLKDTDCYIEPPAIPDPEPSNPGETPVDTTPGDDDWNDDEPEQGETPQDNPEPPKPVWWYHSDPPRSRTNPFVW